jgi:hypothetical protein
MRVLHLSHHYGCLKDHQYICRQLGFELESQFSHWDDVLPYDSYKMSKDLANQIWEDNKDYFNQFDFITTSDTAPISRIFLQNFDEFNGKLNIWVSNRFDYDMHGDAEYYNLFRQALELDRVKVIPYTEFERVWMAQYNIYCDHETVRPIGKTIEDPLSEKDTSDNLVGFSGDHELKDSQMKGDVLVSRYHNDNIFQDSKLICEEQGLIARHAKYRGPQELESIVNNFTCFLMHPDAYSKFTAFELMQMRMPVILPSEEYFFKMSRMPRYFFSTGVVANTVGMVEWYNEYYSKYAVYFDDHTQIKECVEIIKDNKEEICAIIKECAEEHSVKTLDQWRRIYES